VIGAALLVALAAAAILRQQRIQQQRGERLRERYGREYDWTVSEQGRRAGEAELERREELRLTLTRYRSFFNPLLST
jgi:hypothetical protein